MKKIAFFIVSAYILSACIATPLEATVTPELAFSPLPTNTPTAKPSPTTTFTPTPVSFLPERLAAMSNEEKIAAAPEVDGAQAVAYIGHNEVGYSYKNGNLVAVWRAETGEIIEIPQYLQNITPTDIKTEITSIDDLFRVQESDLSALAAIVRYWESTGQIEQVPENARVYPAVAAPDDDVSWLRGGRDRALNKVPSNVFSMTLGALLVEKNGNPYSLLFPTYFAGNSNGDTSVLNKSWILGSQAGADEARVNRIIAALIQRASEYQPMRIFVGKRDAIDVGGRSFTVDGCQDYASTVTHDPSTISLCQDYYRTSYPAVEMYIQQWTLEQAMPHELETYQVIIANG